MSEKDEVIELLSAAQVLDGARWAYSSAAARTLDDYSEDAGYDAAWLGQTRHTLFRDRLDRVFSCGKYKLQAEADDSAGLDLVRAELSDREFHTMPRIPASVVKRADLNHSPGWQFEHLRMLLASCPFGKIDTLPWPQKSPTKQEIAGRRSVESDLSLFDGLAPEEIGGLLAMVDPAIDLETYVIGHTLDPVSHRRELVLGRPRLNRGGGDAWHWCVNLLATPPSGGSGLLISTPPSGPDTVPDAPVRLRSKDDAAKRADNRA